MTQPLQASDGTEPKSTDGHVYTSLLLLW